MPHSQQTRIPDARPARVLGAVTVVYSVAIIIAPKLLASPSGLTGPAGKTSPWVALLIRSIGARDIVSGLAMLLAQPGASLRAACLARAGADTADAALFGSTLKTPGARLKIGGFAGAWAAANLIAAMKAGTRTEPAAAADLRITPNNR